MTIEKEKQGNVQRFKTEFAGTTLTIETGKIALQAHGSCTVQVGETVVLATAVISNQPREGMDFFPLMVDYEERLYAAGIIKGSRWIKREGRPSDEAILSARLIDRSIRPLFDDRIKNDVQVVLTVLSYDGKNDPDFPSMLAACIALSISKIPWKGPVNGVRIGRVVSVDDPTKKEWVINPSAEVKSQMDIDIFVSARDGKILMIETSAKEATEKEVYEAVEKCIPYIEELNKMIVEITKDIGEEKVSVESLIPEKEESESEQKQSYQELVSMTEKWLEEESSKKLFSQELATKESRKEVIADMWASLDEYLSSKSVGRERRKKAEKIFKPYIYRLVTKKILLENKRVDGRKLNQIRPLSSEVSVLPRTHGSALFGRGQTQILSVVTLGSPGDEQLLEGIDESGSKRYMHHYNFPQFSVGETGPMRSPGRREIGHGALAEKALKDMLPSKDEFPYTIRVVSEVTSSNGSSSMGSVCGSTLALMDAGVPLKKPVAGIAMGLASMEGSDDYKIITDLQDLEDGPGGMDFKIAGTKDGITAIQLDTKTQGLSLKIIEETLNQAKIARLEILDVMEKAISTPRSELSKYAPRIVTLQINPEKIRDVIGPGGKIINEIINKTGVQIDIEQDGKVLITSTDSEMSQKAVDWVKSITREIAPGEIFQGRVTKIMDFGAIVQLTPNQSGMVHISELAHYRVNKVQDVVKFGDVIPVKVMNIDDQGRINLSHKVLIDASKKNFQDDKGDDKNKGSFFKRRS